MFFPSALKARIAELELHLKNSTELNSQKSATIDRLREEKSAAIRRVETLQAKRTPVKVKRLVGLKFRALFNGVYTLTEFKTGPGTCGKNVKSFTVSRTDRTITIHQHHIDDSQKDFEYRLGDIDGRIQYDYEMVQVFGEEAEQARLIQTLAARQRQRFA